MSSSLSRFMRLFFYFTHLVIRFSEASSYPRFALEWSEIVKSMLWDFHIFSFPSLPPSFFTTITTLNLRYPRLFLMAQLCPVCVCVNLFTKSVMKYKKFHFIIKEEKKQKKLYERFELVSAACWLLCSRLFPSVVLSCSAQGERHSGYSKKKSLFHTIFHFQPGDKKWLVLRKKT